jgi:hypothetical protein
MFWLAGEIAVLQAGGGDGGAGGAGGAGTLTPACVTVGRCCAMAIVLLRAAPSFGPTMKLTRPLPVPVADDVSMIQPTSTVAVHEHSLVVVTVMLPEPPPTAMLWFAGPISYRHGARWDTRACSPFTTIMPSRVDDPSWGATRKDTSAVPCPVVGANAVIQSTLVDTSHAHSGCVVMVRVPLPPTASIMGVAPSDTTHLTGFGPVLTDEDVSHPDTSEAASSAPPAASNPRRLTQLSAKNSIAGLRIGGLASSKRHSIASIASSQGSPENLAAVVARLLTSGDASSIS